MKKSILSLILLVLAYATYSQSFIKTNSGIEFTSNGITTQLQFYNSSTVRVLKYPQNDKPIKQSLSVIAQAQKTAFNLVETSKQVTLSTNILGVIVDLTDGSIQFIKPDKSLLIKEKDNGSTFTDFDDAGQKTYNVEQVFVLESDEPIYGLGIQQNGVMSKRNQTINMVQNNTEDFITFFQSIKGYGLFWDNYSPTVFSDKDNQTLFKSEVGDCIDYYFMYGNNADGVVAQMRSLTGQVPMFPQWTYGYWQSKERYKSQDELVNVVKKYRELNVPLDGIIQDWQYWGNNYLWNAMEFLNTEFYNPQKMIDDVHNLNAHIIISIWASFGPQTKQFAELSKINALFDFHTWPQSGSEKWPPRMDYFSGVKVYDAYNPAARDIYWNYLNNGIFSLGMDGWWMDSTEPDHLDFKPSDMDTKTYLGSFRKVRNAFPLMTVGGVYDHQRKVSDSKRVFILTRSAFAGQQRYGANTWSGDVFASWNALKNQIAGGLNFSLCAIPYFNSDIGGFFLNAFKDKLNDPDYRELYVRWLQFATFCPMMRSHGADAPREIWNFGTKGTKYYDAIERYINLRYNLIPYIYSTSWDVTANQASMFRALMMDFSNDKKACLLNDEFMLGKSILACPVTTPMYSKDMAEDFSVIKSDSVYLPQGVDWYDFFTGERLSGGKTIVRETPLDIIPVYVKAGSILPFAPKMQYVGQKSLDTLQIRIYEGADAEFVLYEDEGDNYNYEQGKYSTIKFFWNQAKQTLTIDNRFGDFEGMISKRIFNIVKVSTQNGYGESEITNFDKTIDYSGKKTTVKL